MKREKLQEFRIKKKLTQEQMASKLNVTVSHYKAIEYGQRNPSFELMEKIKRTFPMVSIDKIFLTQKFTQSVPKETNKEDKRLEM